MEPWPAGSATQRATLTGYLTPYKIAIIHLVMMYCDDLVPMPFRVAVMTSVLNFIDSVQGAGEFKKYQVIDGDLKVLKAELRGVPSSRGNEDLYGLLLIRLWKLESLDDLHSFFQRIEGYLEDTHSGEEVNNDESTHGAGESEEATSFGEARIMEDRCESRKVKPSSILGSFFRKCYLSFDQLSFDQIAGIWQAFQRFRLSSKVDLSAMERDGCGEGGAIEDDHMHILKNVEQVLIPATETVFISSENLDDMLEYQAERLEKHSSVLPEKTRELLENLISAHQTLPSSAHFVRYLDACKSLDYEKAFDHLHRFYDYTMDSRGRTHYQYALFTLAVLQAQYQGSKEALKAAQEAISVARENTDLACLTQILSWVHSYLVSNPTVEVPESLAIKEQISQYLKTKSGETSEELHALSYQSEIGQIVSKGGSLAAAFEALTKSFYIRISDRPASTTTKLSLAQSTLWNRCGNYTLADTYVRFCSEDEDSTVLLHASIKNSQMLFSRGRQEESLALLDALKPLADVSPSYSQIWLPGILLLKLQRATKLCKFREARSLLHNLRGYSWDDVNLEQEITVAEIQLEFWMENYTKALDLAWYALNRSLECEIDVTFQLRYMLLYTRILMATGEPERAFSLVLKHLLVAQKASLQSLCLEAVVILASILNRKMLNKESLAVIDSNMPAILESGSVELVAETFEILADASLDLSVKSSSRSLLSAWKYIIQSGTHYETSGNLKKLKEVCAKQLMISRLMEDQERTLQTQSVMKSIEKSIVGNGRVGLAS